MNYAKLKNYARKWRNFIIDIIFPLYCLGCGKDNVWLCPACFKKLKFNSSPICIICKRPGPLGAVCGDCQNDNHIDGVIAAGSYKDKKLAELINKYKYYSIKSLAPVLADYISIYLNNYFLYLKIADKNSFDFISDVFQDSYFVPVPIFKRKKRYRGFNQSELILEYFSKKSNININNNLLKTRNTKPQAKLSKSKRIKNLSGSFVWNSGRINKNIILFDDVVTTGSTLNECAGVLKQAGAKQVWGLAIARG